MKAPAAPDIRQLVASAITGSDQTDDPNRTTPLDRIRALAFSDSLGSLLWRLKWANDATAYKPALHLIVHRHGRRMKRNDLLVKIVDCVLREWLDDVCQVCLGRGYKVAVHAAREACPACSTTGLRRHQDQERMRRTGLSSSAYPKWEKEFAAAHSIISAADVSARFGVSAQLSSRPATNERAWRETDPIMKSAIAPAQRNKNSRREAAVESAYSADTQGPAHPQET